MKSTARLAFALLGFVLFTPTYAQDTNSDQADVWAVVENQWNADETGDDKWIDRLLTDDFAGWDRNYPAPRNKSSTRMWDRALAGDQKMKAHELYPLSIIVHGDVAVAHYLYTAAREDKNGATKVSNGRYTDILVRTPDGWQFIGWHGGDDK
ncbi:MAG TPA: nuclear transport factor 2 family protein [Woeseiaceae bacterium]|nr:nuclear transport factor 2 family protein [Woeseiaceae bacterium]